MAPRKKNAGVLQTWITPWLCQVLSGWLLSKMGLIPLASSQVGLLGGNVCKASALCLRPRGIIVTNSTLRPGSTPWRSGMGAHSSRLSVWELS